MRPPTSPFAALAVVLSLASTASAEPAVGQIEVPLALYESLQPTPAPASDPIAPFVEARHVMLTRAEGTAVDIEVVWELDTIEPGLFEGILAGDPIHVDEVLWDGAPASAAWEVGGLRVSGHVSGPSTIVLRGSIPRGAREGGYSLFLLPAATGTARWVGDGVPRFDGGEAPVGPDGAAWTSDRTLGFSVRSAVERAPREALLVASVGIGLSLDDVDLRGRARIRWALRRGEVSAFALDARGLGDDLELTGPGVRSWRRAGARVHVEMQAPVRGAATVELAWTARLPPGAEAAVAIPEIRPVDVFRTSSALQIARDDGVEAVPDLDGWNPAPAAALPRWARDLGDGTPTAAFGTSTAGAPGTLRLLRFEPVAGPPAVVDIADVVVAATQEGRMLIRGRYEVLNDRAPHLDVLLPDGGSPLSARVDGEAVRPVLIDGGLRIPLLRSVETVEGLITFPVEVAVLVDGSDDWSRRERRGLPLLRLSVPIAVHRTTLHLPPGWSDDERGTPDGRVNAFSRGEGVAYGLGGGEAVTGEEREKVDEADALFQSAVGAWKDNRFDEAQGYLDDLGTLGAGNANTVRLQSNLDALAVVDLPPTGGEDEDDDGDLGLDGLLSDETGALNGASGFGAVGDGEEAEFRSYYEAPARTPEVANAPKPASPKSEGRVLRRIKDQAMARAERDRRTLEEATREAEEAERAGDYEKAQEQYAVALEAGKKVGRLAQTESVDLVAKVREVDLKGRSSRRKAKKQKAADPEPRFRNPAAATVEAPPPDDDRVVFDFAVERGPRPFRQLRATTRAVLTPEVGEVVLYQHLLLPAAAPVSVDVRAVRSPRPWSSR